MITRQKCERVTLMWRRLRGSNAVLPTKLQLGKQDVPLQMQCLVYDNIIQSKVSKWQQLSGHLPQYSQTPMKSFIH